MFKLNIALFHASIVMLISYSATQKPKAYPEVVEPCRGASDDFIDLSKLKLSHLKNGTSSFVGGITLKKDLPNTATVSVKLLKKNTAGAWTSAFLMASPDINICTYVKIDSILYPVIARYSTLPRQCPFVKGNYVINSTDWNIPMFFGQPGCYKVTLSLKDKRKTIVCVNIIAKLVTANGSKLPRCL